jgi:hypothetical protein
MKLIRMDDEKVGLFVLLPQGPHIVDIANSLGVFVPHDPLSVGLLNGAFKYGCNWSLIVEHWAHLRSPLQKLAGIAATCPDHRHLVLRPFTEPFHARKAVDPIVAIDISDIACLEKRDPTGRHAMERHFMRVSCEAVPPQPPSDPSNEKIIDLMNHLAEASRT